MRQTLEQNAFKFDHFLLQRPYWSHTLTRQVVTTCLHYALTLLFLTTFTLQIFYSPTHAAPIYPKLTGQIVDRAQMLTQDQKTKLLQQLQELEQKSSDQLVIVTLPSLQGYDIAEFSVELARHWKIGQKGTDNGVLLVIAPKERKMRIEVGYGLEGTLTDILAHKIINNRIKPAFKKGRMFEGILAGTKDIIEILLGNADEVRQRLKRKPSKTNSDPASLFIMLFWGLLFFFPFLSALFGSSQSGKTGGGVHIIPATQQRHNNRHSGGWSSGGFGGGFGGGGGGGFSGGGGSFGGGGSSGSW